jgi:uncharacterized protein (DUF849 family)
MMQDPLLLAVAPSVPPYMREGLSSLDVSPEGIADEVVRAGFEDNPFYRPVEAATSNAQLIERLTRIANELGRPIASPAEARRMLRLADAPSV